MLATNELTPTAPAYLTKYQALAAVSPEVVLQRPILFVVENALLAAASESENTERAYKTAIGLFLQYVSERWKDILEKDGYYPLAATYKEGRKTIWEYRGKAEVLLGIDAGLMDGFTVWRASQGDSRATQNLRRRAVNTFLSVAYRDGIITDEQKNKLGLKPYKKRERKDKKPVGRRLKPDEVRKLRAIIDLRAKTEAKTLRDKALIDLMLYSGLRRSEVADLNTGNFKQDGGRWWIVLQGKGKKTRRLKLHDVLYKSLAAWIKYLNTQESGIALTLGIDDLPIFYNLNKGGNLTGKAINSGVIARIVSEYGFEAGLAPDHGENQLSPHDLRRTCARNAYDNKASLLMVQNMLGHSDPKTTADYIGIYEQDDDTAVDYVRY